MDEDREKERDEELERELPEWLTRSYFGPGEAGMLAENEPVLEQNGPEQVTTIVVSPVPRRRYIYKASEWTRISPRAYNCRVTIRSAKGEFHGEYKGPSVPGSRADIAARATLEALNSAETGTVGLALKGARVLRIFEGPIVVVGVYGMNGGTTPLVGACIVENSVEQSTILATLQAADRWLAFQARERDK